MIRRKVAIYILLTMQVIACSGRTRRQEAQDDTVPYGGKKTETTNDSGRSSDNRGNSDSGSQGDSGNAGTTGSGSDAGGGSGSGGGSDGSSSNAGSGSGNRSGVGTAAYSSNAGSGSGNSSGVVTAASVGISEEIFAKGKQFVGAWDGFQDDLAGTNWKIAVVSSTAQGGTGGFGGNTSSNGTGGVVYNGAVKQLLDRACVSCHNPSGSRANSPLQTYALAKQFGVDVVSLSVAKRMPPRGGMADADIQLLQQWQQAGFPEGGATGATGSGSSIFGTGSGIGTSAGTATGNANEGRGANGAVEFRIRRGTGQGPWNTPQTPVVARVGVPFIIYNDDDIVHQWHTDGSPCQHSEEIAPGQSMQCVPSEVYNGPALYDHITRGPFYIRAE